MLIICYLLLLSMGTIALPSVAVRRRHIEINVLNHNVAVGRSSTYGEFLMWYGLRQIRGMFWTMCCLHKGCVKRCVSSVACVRLETALWQSVLPSHQFQACTCHAGMSAFEGWTYVGLDRQRIERWATSGLWS